MATIFKTADYSTVVAELERRGVYSRLIASNMPNKTLANPHDREIFYLQDQPRLAAWARYSTDWEFNEVLQNLTVRRLTPDITIEIVREDQ